MTGFTLSLQDFSFLIRSASRRHAKQIAQLLSLTVHRHREAVFFKDSADREISLAEAYQASQVKAEVQHQIYNLFMHYLHFG
jgi:hypothetical protein